MAELPQPFSQVHSSRINLLVSGNRFIIECFKILYQYAF